MSVLDSQIQPSAQYQQLLDMLNPAQLEAVKTIEGPVMVLAGPGTGKTQVLAARIAAILQETDTPPQSILAITFTDAGAKNMRERLVSLIGQTGYYVSIMTFHAFCADILAEHSDQFPINPSSQPLSDLERYVIIEDLLTTLPLEKLKPLNDPRHYAKAILEAISNLKKEGYSPDTFAQLVESDFSQPPDTKSKVKLEAFVKKQQKNQELARVFDAYQQALINTARYDFDDMINLVLEAFRTNQVLRQSYQEQYHYLLVDEYQDTNASQNELLWQLSSHWGEAANVFVVGDPHQAIFRFQGASVENVYAFLEKFPRTKLITLTDGYRCPQPIYDAAHQLIGHNVLTTQADTAVETTLMQQLQKPLESQKANNDSTQSSLVIRSAPSDISEWLYIAEAIEELLQEGTAANEIAVLTKTNVESLQISAILAQRGIATQTQTEQNALAVDEVSQVVALLGVVRDLQAGGEARELYSVLLQPWWGLDSVVIYQLVQLAGRQRRSLYDLVKQTEAESLSEKLLEASSEQIAKVREVVLQLETLGILEAQQKLPVWLKEVFDQAKIIDWLREKVEHIPALLAVISFQQTVQDWASERQQYRLTDLLDSIAVLEAHGLKIPITTATFLDQAVELSTIHGAKGREWEHVFLPACFDGKWGNARTRELLPLPDSILKYTDVTKKERNEDERRLFYVALTRARSTTYCSYPEVLLTRGKTKSQVASMFLHEAAVANQLEQVDEKNPDQLQQAMSQLLAPPIQIDRTPAVKKFLSEYMAELRLSVSALNTYLKDPQAFVLQHVLRVPQIVEGHFVYGTAIHAGLEKLVKQHLLKQSVSMSEVLEVLKAGLQRGEFDERDLSRRLDQGTKVLESYHQEQPFQPELLAFSERTFGSSSKPVRLGDIALTGRIDRIDWIDPRAKTARVIDYKASKPQSENAIQGLVGVEALSDRERNLPESIRGPYKRQLLFYKLLTDLDATFQPKVIAGQFEFLHAEGKKVITQRPFELLEEDVAELKKLIKSVMEELRSLAFLED